MGELHASDLRKTLWALSRDETLTSVLSLHDHSEHISKCFRTPCFGELLMESEQRGIPLLAHEIALFKLLGSTYGATTIFAAGLKLALSSRPGLIVLTGSSDELCNMISSCMLSVSSFSCKQ